jgi:hypothetical protein
METTNPAGRLHTILSRAQAALASPNRPVNNAVALWTVVFDEGQFEADSPTQNLIVVITQLLQLRTLIKETEESLKAIEGLADRYFRPFERIRSIPDQSLAALNQDIGGPIRAVTEGDMTVLEFCSERLEERHAEPIIDEAELQGVLEDVNALFDEVKAGDIDPDLKSFILDGLESIRRGIYEFRIRGPLRLKEAIADILASVIMNHEVVRDAEEEESLQKFNKAFSRFAAIVAFASNSVSLLTAFAGPLLGAGTA